MRIREKMESVAHPDPAFILSQSVLVWGVAFWQTPLCVYGWAVETDGRSSTLSRLSQFDCPFHCNKGILIANTKTKTTWWCSPTCFVGKPTDEVEDSQIKTPHLPPLKPSQVFYPQADITWIKSGPSKVGLQKWAFKSGLSKSGLLSLRKSPISV